ncbi:MAG: PilT/PilU family type 4a pilus ATPase [Chitinispirillaceae bacterium]|nr:PilT/PilU family type 4a pilus ATPase [Chitinispirillaceae bacterium]
MDNEQIRKLTSDGVSDLHFKVGRPPLQRIHGIMVATDLPKLTEDDMEKLARQFLGEKNWKMFEEKHQMESAYSIPGFARFRVAVFRQRQSISIVMRAIPYEIPTLDELRAPAIVKKIAEYNRGLVLVTGMTGSGKSSTLAGMVRLMNETYPYHIVTIEDPIEFLHHDQKCSINQREVGDDAEDFASAFKASLRQDPDVILVGELRDIETMEIALRASETGHLVLSTLHTTDAKETIGRFIDAFPPHQQKQIRIQLAANLKAVISQRLLTRADGNGLVLAAEVMIVTAAVRDIITNPEHMTDIVELVARGHDQYGTCTFDQSIMALLEQGLISKEEALAHATNPNDFKLRLSLL